VWNVQDRSLAGVFAAKKHPAFCASAFSPDGQLLAIGTSQGVLLLDGENASLLATLDSGSYTHSLACSPDAEHLAWLGVGGIGLWEVRSEESLADSPRSSIDVIPIENVKPTRELKKSAPPAQL
jgi:hypothetical protein